MGFPLQRVMSLLALSSLPAPPSFGSQYMRGTPQAESPFCWHGLHHHPFFTHNNQQAKPSELILGSAGSLGV